LDSNESRTKGKDANGGADSSATDATCTVCGRSFSIPAGQENSEIVPQHSATDDNGKECGGSRIFSKEAMSRVVPPTEGDD